jgi:hypothetical protein
LLSPEELRAARLRAIGVPKKEVAKMVGRSYGTVAEWERGDEFCSKIEEYVGQHAAALEAALLEGEKAAVATLIGALDAEDGNGQPDWNTRTKAAIRFLEMQGQRGKPIEKQIQQQTTLTGDVNKLLESALRDPAVRAIIARDNLLLPSGEQKEEIPEAEYEVIDERPRTDS